MRQVHLGLAHLAGAHLDNSLYRDTSPDQKLARYGEAFGLFEAGCATDSRWSANHARDLDAGLPPHVKVLLRHPGPEQHQTWATANAPILASKRAGPIHLPWQGPWSEQSEARLDALLTSIWDEVPSSGRVAVEFHHPSWFRTEPMRLLEEHLAGLVWSAGAGMIPYRATSDFLYVRIKGTKVRPMGEDGPAFLQRVRARSQDPRPVYVVGARPEAYSLRALERFARGMGLHWSLSDPVPAPQASLGRFAIPA